MVIKKKSPAKKKIPIKAGKKGVKKVVIKKARSKIGINPSINQATQLKSRIRILEEVLSEAVDAFNGQRLMNAILNWLRENVHADAGTVMFLNRETGELIFETVQGEAAAELEGYRMPMTEGIAGWVAQNGKSVIVPKAVKDSRYNPAVQEMTRYETRNMVCVPIKFKRTLVGVLQLINHEHRHPFSRKDQAVCENYAQILGLILSKRNRELTGDSAGI